MISVVVTENPMPLEQKMGCIIPMTIRFLHGELRINAYPSFEPIAEKMQKMADSRKMDAGELIDFFADEMSQKMREYGYSYDADASSAPYDLYEADQKHLPDEKMVTSDTWKLDGDEVAFGISRNGEIVSCASANAPLEEDEEDVISIEVETEDAWQKKGFAASCAAALIRYLMRTGSYRAVQYECSEANIASERVAQKLGLTLVERRCYFVGYLEEE